MKSVGAMVEQLAAMLGTNDLSPWEQGFVQTVQRHAKQTTTLTEKQVDKIEQLYEKHFGDTA